MPLPCRNDRESYLVSSPLIRQEYIDNTVKLLLDTEVKIIRTFVMQKWIKRE